MIKLIAEEKFNCSLEKVVSSLMELDKIYSLYCPEEHIKCKFIKGNPLDEGSVLYFEELIAGKKQIMKYKVYKITDRTREKNVILEAMFPRSLLNIRAVLNVKEFEDGVKFTRTITVGKEDSIIGTIIDKLFFIFLGKDYYTAMIEHNKEDLEKLKCYIENN